jgi:predicted metalloprotease
VLLVAGLVVCTSLGVSAPAQAQSGGRYFPETGKTVRGPFLKYWLEHGGLPQQGYPISNEMQERSDTDGKVYTVQYFERAVFEYHPENRPPHDVLLSLLGVFKYQEKYPEGAPGQKPNTSAGSVYFPQTGKRLGGRFLRYWRTHGGLPQQGYPISDEFTERSELDGKTYTVQYFERAVFEYHPENAGTPYEVLLSQLGTFRYQAKYGAIGGAPGDADADGFSDEADDCPNEAENLNKIFDTDGCPDSMDDLIGFAASDLNQFWADMFADSGLHYEPPTELVAYNEPIRTACGVAVPNNAFYCRLSHGIYYHEDFLIEQLNTDGDFAPVVIIAHEWGHLVQANLGLLTGDRFTIEKELEADCLAGVWAAHAGEMGYLEEGDLEEGAIALFRAGDDLDTPWFDPNAHGQPEQRVQAFIIGLEQGVEACLGE